MFGAFLRYGIVQDQATSAHLHSCIEGCKGHDVEACHFNAMLTTW
jgi:hypothetical protein